ncbi:methyl-accepting chemotaxis protein [Alicyclobacillus fastidiosus]|uniref:methyl-accepting chemotaxis protein n=1 Tax=Alicyclobacillus fastidiosus TaxID=392011 RepID=UPI0034D79884
MAVVAHEVRKLAKQTATSAQEVSQVITTIQTEIDEVIQDTERNRRSGCRNSCSRCSG